MNNTIKKEINTIVEVTLFDGTVKRFTEEMLYGTEKTGEDIFDNEKDSIEVCLYPWGIIEIKKENIGQITVKYN